MIRGGFFEQKRASPSGLALVVALHAAALGAVLLIKGPRFIVPARTPTEAIFIPAEKDPPPEVPPPPPGPERPLTRHPTVIELPPPPDAPPAEDAIDPPALPLLPPSGTGSGTTIAPPADPPHVPVRVEASVDPRYADALQPPYPPSEQRAEREGTVRIRVTIGADGRVRAVERLSATSDAFWRVTERQALSRWRFRPATEDGRPVESRRVMTVHFRLDG